MLFRSCHKDQWLPSAVYSTVARVVEILRQGSSPAGQAYLLLNRFLLSIAVAVRTRFLSPVTDVW